MSRALLVRWSERLGSCGSCTTDAVATTWESLEGSHTFSLRLGSRRGRVGGDARPSVRLYERGEGRHLSMAERWGPCGAG